MRTAALAILFLASSCPLKPAAPSTGNDLVDLVVLLEDGQSECVQLYGTTTISDPDPDGPPVLLVPDDFGDASARAAASMIATESVPENEVSIREFGTSPDDRCLLSISLPVISGEFAFVEFSNAGGQLGAYAFRRSNDNWVVVERRILGFW